MTCPVCGRPYAKRLEVSDLGGEPSVRADFEVCRARQSRHTDVWYLHDPAAEDRGIVGDFLAGVREGL